MLILGIKGKKHNLYSIHLNKQVLTFSDSTQLKQHLQKQNLSVYKTIQPLLFYIQQILHCVYKQQSNYMQDSSCFVCFITIIIIV